MTVEQGNKIIAEFDGAKIDKKSYGEWWYQVKNTDRFGYASQLEYHSSWDWLMPTAKKAYDEINLFINSRDDMRTALANFDIKEVWRVTIRYINILKNG